MANVVQGLEVHDPAGAVLSVIRHYYDAEWKQVVNAADVLTFSCPAFEGEHLIYPNEVWIRRGDSASLMRKFVIGIVEEREGARAEVRVTAHDYSVALMRVAVAEFPSEEEETPEMLDTQDYLDAALALASDTGIVWGTLPVIPEGKETLPYSELHAVNTNVLALLHRVRQSIGGMLWVDNEKQLHWYQERFAKPPKEYRLELDRNCIETRRKTDWMGAEPVVHYDVDVVDLSAHGGLDDGLLNIGMPVWIPIPNAPEPVQRYITDISQKIDTPLSTKIAVNDTLDSTGRFRDLLDYMMDTGDATNRVNAFIQKADPIVNNPEGVIEGVIEDAGFVQFGKAKVFTLDADGDNLNCYLWDSDEEEWEEETTKVLKPFVLRKSTYAGKEIPYLDGRVIEYDVTDLDAKYQRHATWDDGEEVQEITAIYGLEEEIQIRKEGNTWVDTNEAGRHWAAVEEEEA